MRCRCLLLALVTVVTNGREAAAQALGIPEPPPITVGALRLSGYVQGDAELRDNTDTAAPDMFRLRRVRVNLSGPIARQIDFMVQGDLVGPQIPREVYVTFKQLRFANVRAGQFIAPFSLERLTSTARLEVIERVLTAIVPSRDIGVMVLSPSPLLGVLKYSAAVVNGTGENRADDNDAKDAVGRLEIAPPRVPGLSFAVNGSTGSQPTGDRHRVGADVSFERRAFRVAAELVRETHPGTTIADRRGYYALGIWRMWPSHPSPNLALIELVGRYYSLTRPDGVHEDVFQGGANYHFSPAVKIMANGLFPRHGEENHTPRTFITRLQLRF